jgi:hypothetical protein
MQQPDRKGGLSQGERTMNERMKHVANETATTREEARLDETIAQAMAPLRLLEPTDDLRLKNRRRLAAALVEQERQRLSPRLPLWRRSITLPLPLIALIVALTLAAGIALAWMLDIWSYVPKPVAPAPIAAAQTLDRPMPRNLS